MHNHLRKNPSKSRLCHKAYHYGWALMHKLKKRLEKKICQSQTLHQTKNNPEPDRKIVNNNTKMQKSKRELVENILKKNTDGLTVIEISKLLNISRNTVAVALAELKGANLIRIRPIGKAKLNYWGRGK